MVWSMASELYTLLSVPTWQQQTLPSLQMHTCYEI